MAGLLHQALTAQLQLPQVGVQEQRVELDRAARLEQRLQLGDALVEDRLGDLSAAGQLGPVARVGRRGDDLGVDRGGVMPASRIGERPVRRVNFVDSFTEPSGRVTTDGA